MLALGVDLEGPGLVGTDDVIDRGQKSNGVLGARLPLTHVSIRQVIGHRQGMPLPDTNVVSEQLPCCGSADAQFRSKRPDRPMP